MKKNFFAVGAALYTFGIIGCNNERMEGLVGLADKQVTMNIRASEPETRADYTDDGGKMNFSWRNGDAISVEINGVAGNENCRLTTSTIGRNALFSGKVAGWVGGNKPIYAFYPYSSTPYTILRGDDPKAATSSLNLPNPQSYTLGGAVSNSFMVGIGSAVATGETIDALASMKQVMSIVKLNITNAPGKVKEVKLSCTEAVFPTTATVALATAEISAPGSLVSELSMTVTDNTTGGTKAVSFAMFPVDLSSKKIRIELLFEDDESRVIEKAGTNFVRNMHYVLKFDGDAPQPKPDPLGDIVLFAQGVSLESGWHDQNKSLVGDRRLCWACTESNMIQWWQDRYVAAGKTLPPGVPNGIIPGRENEVSRQYAIFEEYHIRNFPNMGSDILTGIPRYFTTYFPEVFPDTKPFFSEKTYARTAVFRSLKEFSDFVVAELKEGGVIGLGLLGHAATLWGATYNHETGLVKNVFMTDSDDRDNGSFHHGVWKRSVGENKYGNPTFVGGKEIEAATVLYPYPGK